MPGSGKSSVIFDEDGGESPAVFVKSSGKRGSSDFFVALCETGRYNNKPRQAAEGTPYVDKRSEQHSGPVHYSGSGTGSFGAEKE
ncbi:hypothetical protein [uncultured Oscillibacter sp.]|uniref:hypothetical protein n=1 Tax=uncultured Oscillibacter sp. TaxID=876091 RepID=UPI002605D966|nr:hypothetical protein [uncultured Oscillibacter sp.]